MILLSFVSLGLHGAVQAAPPGYSALRERDGCAAYVGPANGGAAPMRIECRWPGVSVEQVDALLSHPERDTTIFSRVRVSQIVGKVGDRLQVLRVHDFTPLEDRQGVVEITRRVLADGVRFEWHLAPVQPRNDDLVTVERDTGFWLVQRTQDGVALTLETEFDPGGTVRRFLTHNIMASTMLDMVAELRAHLR